MSIFSSVPSTPIRFSSHREDHRNSMTFNFGGLYPIMTEYAYPNERWTVGLESFIRTMPLMAPVLDMANVKVDCFFVPFRLIWDDFEDFITLGLTGEANYAIPTIERTDNTPTSQASADQVNQIFGIGGLADYLGFSTNAPATVGVSFHRRVCALPFRAYQLIYNEYFRNQSLQNEISIARSSGNMTLSANGSSGADYADAYANYYLRNRNWQRDYFTASLPTPQKGPDVNIPYGDIDISDDGSLLLKTDHSNIDPLANVIAGGGNPTDIKASSSGSPFSLSYDSGLKATLDADDLPTIEQLRYAEVLQEYFEANARGGTRYKEHLLNIWHQRSRDGRLDRPEYLGGYRGPVSISEVLQQSESNTTVQGTMTGKGLSVGGSRLFRYHVPEYGIIMCIMSVVAKSSYFQGDRRQYLYKDAFDIPNPFFGNLGEQPVYNGEILFKDSASNDYGTFGYLPRYSEVKFIPDSVHGQFRNTLRYWTMSRKFTNNVNLNSAFVQQQSAEMSHIFPNEVADDDKLVGQFYFHVKRRTPFDYYGVPRMLHVV